MGNSHINILISLNISEVTYSSFCGFVLDWADAENYNFQLESRVGVLKKGAISTFEIILQLMWFLMAAWGC